MRKALLACSLLAALTGAAKAQVIVDAPTLNIFSQLGLTNQFTELARWGQQLQAMQQQYQTLMNTYNAMAHVTDLGSAVGALGMVGIQNPLPVNPYALQGLLNGSGGAQGMISSLGSLYNGTKAANTVYQVPGNSWAAQQINANGGGIAGAQAVFLQIYQSAAQRVPLLNELQARISTSTDQSEREALIARFGAEQAYIQNANLQAQAVGGYMQAQFALQKQQSQERMQQGIDEILADAQAKGICRSCAN